MKSIVIGVCFSPGGTAWFGRLIKNLERRTSDSSTLGFILVANGYDDLERLKVEASSIKYPVHSIHLVEPTTRSGPRTGSVSHSMGVNFIYENCPDCDMLVINDQDAFVTRSHWDQVSFSLFDKGVDLFGVKYPFRTKYYKFSESVAFKGMPYQRFPTLTWVALNLRRLRSAGLKRLTAYDALYGTSQDVEPSYILGLPSSVRNLLGLPAGHDAWLIDTGFDLPFMLVDRGLRHLVLERACELGVEADLLHKLTEHAANCGVDTSAPNFPEEFLFDGKSFLLHYKHSSLKMGQVQSEFLIKFMEVLSDASI